MINLYLRNQIKIFVVFILAAKPLADGFFARDKRNPSK